MPGLSLSAVNIKMRESLYLLPVLHTEALELPITVERATCRRPHAYMYLIVPTFMENQDLTTYFKPSTVAAFLTVIMKLSRFPYVKNERR